MTVVVDDPLIAGMAIRRTLPLRGLQRPPVHSKDGPRAKCVGSVRFSRLLVDGPAAFGPVFERT